MARAPASTTLEVNMKLDDNGVLVNDDGTRPRTYPHPKGYVSVYIPGLGPKLEHRVVWELAHGECPKYLDHINRDKTDNRLANLRPATHADNHQNRPAPASNTSGVKGLSYEKGANRWVGQIMWHGQLFLKKSVDRTKVEAWLIQKRNELAGQFACH